MSFVWENVPYEMVKKHGLNTEFLKLAFYLIIFALKN